MNHYSDRKSDANTALRYIETDGSIALSASAIDDLFEPDKYLHMDGPQRFERSAVEIRDGAIIVTYKPKWGDITIEKEMELIYRFGDLCIICSGTKKETSCYDAANCMYRILDNGVKDDYLLAGAQNILDSCGNKKCGTATLNYVKMKKYAEGLN